MKERPFDSDNNKGKGSSGKGELFFLAVGRIRKPHGIRGEVSMSVLTDFPERFQPKQIVYLGERHTPVHIRSLRWNKGDMLIAFEEFPDRTAVEVLRSQFVYVRSAQAPELPDGEYYHHEVLGLQVITDTGEELGLVEDVLETGANDVLVVIRPDGREALIPMITEVILEIDLEAEIVRVHLIPGLLEE